MYFIYTFNSNFSNKHLIYMNLFSVKRLKLLIKVKVNWRSSSLSELTPILFNMGLTHLGFEASNCQNIKRY